jgi:osmotically-inducible protein OsmY
MKNSKAVVVLAALLASALSLSACTSTATHESTGQVIDSSSITVAVKAKLAADSDISSLKISVSTFKDVVTLHGHVATEAQKHKAVEDAKSVAGVSEVRDELMVGHHHHHHSSQNTTTETTPAQS